MGSNESHFNVSSTVRDKVRKPCPQTTTFEEKGEPKRYRTDVLPLTSGPNRLSFYSIAWYLYSVGNHRNRLKSLAPMKIE